MNSVHRNINLLLKLLVVLKVLCHLTIVGMAIFFITCLALNPSSTNGMAVVQYILYIWMIASNLFPLGAFYALPHIAWLGINLIITILSKGNSYGLIDNDGILEYLNRGPFSLYEMRTRILFYASLAAWSIVFVAFVASLILGMGFNMIEEKKKERAEEKPINEGVYRKMDDEGISRKSDEQDIWKKSSAIEVISIESVFDTISLESAAMEIISLESAV